MNNLTRKKLSRSALRNHCKNLEVSIDGFLADPNHDNLHDLNALKLNYDTQVKKILRTENEIANLITEDEALPWEMEDTLVVNDIVYQYISNTDALIQSLVQSMEIPKIKDSTPPNSPPRPMSNYAVTPREPKVRLRKLELKPFDGNILNWQPFWDQFDSSVHNQPYLSDIDKFSYLKTFLTSAAASCISGLAITRDNYAEAIDLLHERFGNK